MCHSLLFAILALAAEPLAAAGPATEFVGDRPAGSIAFASLAPRGWDLYLTDVGSGQTQRLTHHPALDFNASFAPDGRRLAYVTERDGNAEIYAIHVDGTDPERLTAEFALDDHPAFSPDGKQIAFASTRQPADEPGRAWTAVYVMNAAGSDVRRLSGSGAADYSPAWSPRGDLIAVASGSGVAGGSDVYVMKPDGSDRRLVAKNGGWPTFSADGAVVYFHSQREGHWGIWRAGVDGTNLERITPSDVDAFTPNASADGRWLVAAVKRGEHRQIARIDLSTRAMTDVTTDETDHWNPSISPDGRLVVYHKQSPDFAAPNVELWGVPPGTDLQMLRLAGSFPSFSPDGKNFALTGGNFSHLDVMNSDGSDRKTIYSAAPRSIFSISWAHVGDRVAFSLGTTFEGPAGKVDIASIRPDGSDFQRLTADPANDAFPSFSPDGRQLVFRSGRGGSKNLYIMDSEGANVRRLTEGSWTDTMVDWSPTGEWIAFASDRGGNFEIWLVKLDGSQLHKLIGGGGRNNHPHFAPDGGWVVFTSQRAGYSVEEMSLPHQFQPYGDLFAVRVDGTGLIRLTHNGFEEGTPAWGPPLAIKPSAKGSLRSAGEY